jgi:hypothetical protein
MNSEKFDFDNLSEAELAELNAWLDSIEVPREEEN